MWNLFREIEFKKKKYHRIFFAVKLLRSLAFLPGAIICILLYFIA